MHSFCARGFGPLRLREGLSVLQQALQKIQREIADAPNDPYVKYTGAELIKYVRDNPDHAELFIAADKTIKGSFKALESEASKGRRSFIPPDEGKIIILKYFGVDAPAPAAPATVAVPQISASIDDLI
jgi:hypothetical protein